MNDSIRELKLMANTIRRDIIDIAYKAQGPSHPGPALSCTDIVTALYFDIMRVDPDNPQWENRDRLVLSKGHACPVIYSALAEKGYFPKEWLETVRRVGSHLQGHPDMKKTPGVDMTSGSLGNGLAAALGMAVYLKHEGKSSQVYCILGDGEIQEGQVWEASMFAAAKKLDNLVVIVDNNNLQIDGTIEEVNSPYPIPEKFAAFGFHVIEIDGNDLDAIDAALAEARTVKGKPTAIVQKSVKGRGVSFMENQCSWHGSAPNDEQYEQAMAELTATLKELEG